MLKKLAICASTFAMTAACGGTSLGIAEIGSGPLSASEVARFATAIDNFSETVQSPTTSAALRSNGNATYNGILALGRVSLDDTNYGTVIGRTQLNVGFSGNGTVSGSATDFVYSQGETEIANLTDAQLSPVTGTITYSGGEIDRSGATATLSFKMNGSMQLPSGYSGLPGTRTATVTGDAAGGFVDDRVAFVAGPEFVGDGINFQGFGFGIAED